MKLLLYYLVVSLSIAILWGFGTWLLLSIYETLPAVSCGRAMFVIAFIVAFVMLCTGNSAGVAEDAARKAAELREGGE